MQKGIRNADIHKQKSLSDNRTRNWCRDPQNKGTEQNDEKTDTRVSQIFQIVACPYRTPHDTVPKHIGHCHHDPVVLRALICPHEYQKRQNDRHARKQCRRCESSEQITIGEKVRD